MANCFMINPIMINRTLLKFIAVILMLSLSSSIKAEPNQAIPAITENARAQFDIQQQDFFISAERQYRIFIAVPRTPAPASGYPVLYTLDGNIQFPLAVNSYRAANGKAPLIISIGYPIDTAYDMEKRTRDYTVAAPGDEFAKGGQAELFFHFISQQLKPWVNDRYPVDSKRQTLVGHSFGGLFTLYTLFNHPDEFQRYIAASPSIWWGNGIVIPDRSPLLKVWPESITITVGEYEEQADPDATGSEEDRERDKRKAQRRLVTKARTLAETLKQQGSNSQFIVFPERNHGSVIPDALAMAVIVAGQ